MGHLFDNNCTSHSDIHIHYSNVRPNVSVEISSCTENGRMISKRVHRSENDPESQRDQKIGLFIYKVNLSYFLFLLCE